jgi:hypothetical protein
MSDRLKISWKINEADTSVVSYFINGKKIGENDNGFKKLLRVINDKKTAAIIIKTDAMYGLGGETTEDHFPFKERMGELQEALGGRKLIYEFI